MRSILLLGLALLSGCSMACEGDSAKSKCACSATASTDSAVASCTAALDDTSLSTERRAEMLYRRALAYHRAGDPAHALSDLDALLKLQPDAGYAYTYRGAIRGERGDYANSILDSNRALELDPRSVSALRNLAHAYSDSGDHARALKEFQRGVALAPNDAPLIGATCWERAVLGIELEVALVACTKAIVGAPSDGNFYNSRGFVRFRLGDAAGAVTDYDRSIALDPKVASSYYMRGRAKARLGDASANADIERGVAGEAGVAARYASYGVKAD